LGSCRISSSWLGLSDQMKAEYPGFGAVDRFGDLCYEARNDILRRPLRAPRTVCPPLPGADPAEVGTHVAVVEGFAPDYQDQPSQQGRPLEDSRHQLLEES